MINLTEDASNKFLTIFKNKELPENSAIRFTVKGGGCSGFTLDVQIEPPRRFDMARRADDKFVSNDVRILVDKKSLLFLDGMTVRLRSNLSAINLSMITQIARVFAAAVRALVFNFYSLWLSRIILVEKSLIKAKNNVRVS